MRTRIAILASLFLLSSTLTLVAQEQAKEKKKLSSSLFFRAVSSLFSSSQEAPAPSASRPELESIDEESTHEQVDLIKCVNGQGEIMPVNSFCLNAEDEIMAGCGTGPGEIRIYDADGKFLRQWAVPVKPEAVNTARDGVVLVAGNGRVFQFTAEGKLIREAKAPHTRHVQHNYEELRKQIEAQLRNRTSVYQRQIELYEKRIAVLRGKEDLSDRDQRQLESLKRVLEQMTQLRDREQGRKLTDEQIEAQVKAMTSRKTRIASISSDGSSIYVAVPATVGYGFEIWRMDGQFENGEKIVSGLRGCCSQMDVQACKNGIFVAENSRHRVVHYDRDGKLVASWGKRDRTGVDGFTSCCNPMNVAFGANGDVYTAESTTGRIKRFTPKGELVQYVGDVKLVPGCKNVSIAVSKDGQRVYMLDITRNHIVLMKQRAASNDGVAAARSRKQG